MNVRWIWNRCARFEKQLSLLAAGVLPDSERQAMEAHLKECEFCQARLVTLRRLTRRLETLGRQLPQALPSPALRSRWQTAIRAQAPSPQPRGSVVEMSLRWLHACFAGGRPTWALVCVVWVLSALFRISAPTSYKPASAAVPVTMQDIRLVLEKNRMEEPTHSTRQEDKLNPLPPSPRSQGPIMIRRT